MNYAQEAHPDGGISPSNMSTPLLSKEDRTTIESLGCNLDRKELLEVVGKVAILSDQIDARMALATFVGFSIEDEDTRKWLINRTGEEMPNDVFMGYKKAVSGYFYEGDRPRYEALSALLGFEPVQLDGRTIQVPFINPFSQDGLVNSKTDHNSG